ncbi:MAG: sigma-70 family RNA polymerase sigma factor [Clostridia bacterium]|nr:sigma-70 family RNA polymerase sigma factor [Clostridia bacterium]MBP3801741.1 sigma-70 family RNA polymerase sigma factor [Clostridia bacterium]
MENKNELKEAKFNSFLNKTIIMTSKNNFIKQMKYLNKEQTIFDNEDYSAFLQNFIALSAPVNDFEKVELESQLNSALNCLSVTEQAVIFLLFNKNYSQNDAAKMLKLYSKSISKIKIRAIKKLKKYLEGDF